MRARQRAAGAAVNAPQAAAPPASWNGLFAEGSPSGIRSRPHIRPWGRPSPEGDAATARLAYRRRLPDVAADALVSAFALPHRSLAEPGRDGARLKPGAGLRRRIPAAAPLRALTPSRVRALEQQRRFARPRARAGGLWKEVREASTSLEAHLPGGPTCSAPDVMGTRRSARSGGRPRRAGFLAAGPGPRQPTALPPPGPALASLEPLLAADPACPVKTVQEAS